MIFVGIKLLLAFLVAYMTSLFVIPKLANIARSIGLVDIPGTRKVHVVPRALVGGIGIVITATFSSMLFAGLSGVRGLFLGLALLLFVGFLDDFRELGSQSKFGAQIIASILMMYFSKVFLLSFGDLLGIGSVELPDIAWVVCGVTIFCVVGVINSINLIDGLDGLAGGISFISFITFAFHAFMGDQYVLVLVNLAFAGAVLGFLRYNWHPSSIFMGDAGSLCLGFTLAFMAIALSQGKNACISPVVPLLVLAVPITDTVTVMTRRLVRGQNPFKADQHHMHHLFMCYGLSLRTAVKVILGICIVLSGITLLVPFVNIPDYLLFGVYLLYIIFYFFSSFIIIHTIRLGQRDKRLLVTASRQQGAVSSSMIRFFLNTFHKLTTIRKDRRYQFLCTAVVRLEKDVASIAGTLGDISEQGCMVITETMETLQGNVRIEFSVPLDDETVVIVRPAEHVWMAKSEKGILNGFRFREVDTVDKNFISLVERLKKHSFFVRER